MRKQIVVISFVMSLLAFGGMSYAQEIEQEVLDEQEQRLQEALRQQFNNSEIYTPYQIRLMYKEQLKSQQELSDKQAALKMLADSFQYTPEELQKASENFEENPPYENLLNPDETEVMEKMIQDDLAGAFAKIVSSGAINSNYMPSDKQDEKPLLEADNSDNNISGEPAYADAASNVQIPSVQVLPTKPVQEEKRRLGKKSYNLNPENFIYEENQ